MSTHQPTWRKHGDRQPHNCKPVFAFEGKMMHIGTLQNRKWDNDNSDNFAFMQIEGFSQLKEWSKGDDIQNTHVNSFGIIKRIILRVTNNLVNRDFKIILQRDEVDQVGVIFPIIGAGEVATFRVNLVNLPLVFDHRYAYKFETLDGVKPLSSETLRLSISTLIFWGAGDP